MLLFLHGINVLILSFAYYPYLHVQATQDYYFSDLCAEGYKEVTVSTSSSGDNVTGILRANHNSPSKNGRNCTLILVPPEYYGVVLGFDELDLQKSGSCVGNLTVSQSINGSAWSEVFKECITDVGQPPLNVTGSFKINYVELPGNSLNLRVTYTTYYDSPCLSSDTFKCSNWICIPKGLKCDGVNNCGDNSDEWPHVSCPNPSAIIGGVFGGVVLLLCGAGYLVYRIRNRTVSYSAFESEPAPAAPYSSRHLDDSSHSDTTRQQKDSTTETMPTSSYHDSN